MDQEKLSQYQKLKKTLESVDERTLESVFRDTDKVIDPFRKSALQRFPTLFILLSALGLVMTFYGFERLIEEWVWLYERPFIILVVGLSFLFFTGAVYKRLG